MQEHKNRILTFLPVMKELELMGHNPVDIMFGERPLTIEDTENAYIAITRAKEKYPEWYEVVAEWIDKMIYARI